MQVRRIEDLESKTLTMNRKTVLSLSAVAVIAGKVRLGVAALSSDGRLACSVHFDADGVPVLLDDMFDHPRVQRLIVALRAARG